VELGDALEAALDRRDRAPALAEGRKEINSLIRRNASWPSARGLDPDVAADQDRDDATGRFTGGGLDQGARGSGAAPGHRTASEQMTAKLRAAFYGDSEEES